MPGVAAKHGLSIFQSNLIFSSQAIAQLCAALCVVMAVLSALMMDAAAPDKAKQG